MNAEPSLPNLVPTPRPAAAVMASTSRLPGLSWAALAVLIFSGWFIATRFTVTHSLRIWDVMALRFGVGSVLMLPALLRPRFRPTASQWREGFVLSLLWGAPFVLFVALGLQLTSAAQASTVTPALMPVFAGLIAWFALKEAPGAPRLAGYAAITLGLAVLLWARTNVDARSEWPGVGSLVLAALGWAVYTLRFRRSTLSPMQAAALICVWSAALFLPFYLGLGLSHLQRAGVRELVVQALYQGVCMSIVAVFAFNRAVGLLGPRAASAIIAFVPVTATLLAIPILGEPLAWIGGCATAAISIGVILAARPAAPIPPESLSS